MPVSPKTHENRDLICEIPGNFTPETSSLKTAPSASESHQFIGELGKPVIMGALTGGHMALPVRQAKRPRQKRAGVHFLAPKNE